MKNFFKYTIRTLALTALLVPITTHAFVIDSNTAIGSEFTVNYLLAAGATDPNGNTNQSGQDISATVVFELLDYNTDTNTISLQLNVKNTSDNDGNEVGLQAIAFGTNPTATGISFTQISNGDVDRFTGASLTIDPQLNNAVANLGVQSSTPLIGGYNSNLQEGEHDIFQLDVSFLELPTTGVTFTPFGSKWQTDPDSFQFGGTEPNGNGNGGPPFGVPEPHTILLMGIGLLGFGATRLRGKANA